MSAFFEIVPNISEGRDAAVVDACAAAMTAAGARVIDRSSDVTHHRSVLTAVGGWTEALTASVALAGIAAARIDVRRHRGEHPRIGALDVLPFVPLRGASLADAAALAREAGAAIWAAHRIPSYFYGAAASADHRRLLADVRRGEFEGLVARLSDPLWAPDVGDDMHASAGAIAIGARELLIAFNVELRSENLTLAKMLARTLRERNGGFLTLRALGLVRRPGIVQLSFNVTDPDAVPLYRIVEMSRALAAEWGVEIARSELVGLAPRRAMRETAAYYLARDPEHEHR
ncbi:MAG: glutamate formimidoyltransferase [Candidatus Eremiobacteraeota bacterium]|nr:glutamate formimidoyltransferase [Candidatus Eremiobacteraeota bacterium]MBV8353999.1 glutamate formimidoyltransferase [Candidatus Eremiobacteraeota bacterium]